jgi:alanyl-tRNA synthetase
MSSHSLNLSTLRRLYLDFFVNKGHVIVPSANLVPENDPSTLFTSAGMQAMIPYFLGENHPQGKRIVNSQKCFRSEDIEEVGDNRHTTFFEMLGNWSFGDYFKKEQIEFFFEFLVDVLKLDPKRLYISVFAGNQELNIPKDSESASIWQNLFQKKGIEAKIIDNPQQACKGQNIFLWRRQKLVVKIWGSRTDAIGEPGGPDSEVFYDFADLNSDQLIHQQSLLVNKLVILIVTVGVF